MSRKKLSIHDVLNEDRTQFTESSEEENQSSSAPVDPQPPKKGRKARGRPPKKSKQTESPLNSLFKGKESKADYVRLSITLPPDLFDRLQMVSIRRRRRKESYTFCHLVREAIQEWIDQAEEE